MSFMKSTKRFFRAVNKKLVERSPISSVYPFNKVNKDSGPPHIQSVEEKKEEK